MAQRLTCHTLTTIAILVVAPVAARAQGDRWQVGTASGYSTGRYGTDTSTAVVYTPTTARRLFADGDLTLVFPFTCISGSGVTVVNGSPVQNERGAVGMSGTGGPTDRPGTNQRERGTNATTPPASVADRTAAPATICGMGDMVVRGRYYLVDERDWMPTIAIRAHLKAPTGSAMRGLGTGRPDEGIGIEISRTIAGGLLLMADTGYTVIGKPAGVPYQNNWWYDAGIARNVANDAVNLSVFIEEYRAILPGFESARSVLVSAMVRSATGWRLQVSGQIGLSDGAPDHGLTLGASRRF